MVAVSHSIVVAHYHILQTDRPFIDLGWEHFVNLNPLKGQVRNMNRPRTIRPEDYWILFIAQSICRRHSASGTETDSSGIRGNMACRMETILDSLMDRWAGNPKDGCRGRIGSFRFPHPPSRMIEETENPQEPGCDEKEFRVGLEFRPNLLADRMITSHRECEFSHPQ